MAEFTELRRYPRCTKTICKAVLSIDGKHWSEVEICDISAGGLKFSSKKNYDVKEKLLFNITVYNVYSEFNMNFEGMVVRKETVNSTGYYGVKFINVNKYHQIQLDEIIKANVSLKSDNHQMHEDGVYAFMFIPKTKKSRIPTYR